MVELRDALTHTAAAEDVSAEKRWVDGFFEYSFRGRVRICSDPRGTLVRGTGRSMWSAGEVLADFLAERPELFLGKDCLELGAGVGGVGLTLAALGAKRVVLTDLAAQVPLLERNVKRNFSGCDHVHAKALDWRSEEERNAFGVWNQSWSLIVASDVGYDPDLFAPLLATLVAQSTPSTAVYLALADRDEEDEPNVLDFIASARHLFDCKEVHARQVEPGQSVTKVLELTRLAA
eukprot:TRINITY_DN35327_c0_g1_i1.p1 TRINITY_DN35327_c0_g1~~TRINITY_DN35327_c0_g1_i1.p1  ORF type:complete len:234 (-),score=47.72 TRINITY_DN35327_c0_g1_i1:12-713(-)